MRLPGPTTFLAVPEKALNGVVFDLPHTAAGGNKQMETAGLTERCEAASGDFFEKVPVGGDVYISIGTTSAALRSRRIFTERWRVRANV